MTQEALILPATTPDQLRSVRELLLEYWNSRNLSFSVFDFDQELASLPGNYAPPGGCLLIAGFDGETAGCVALRRLDDTTCEMKRLYVRPAFRGRGLGAALAQAIIVEARRLGYSLMRLDTIGPSMQEAFELYRRLGFHEIPAYRHNPLPGAIYMEMPL